MALRSVCGLAILCLVVVGVTFPTLLDAQDSVVSEVRIDDEGVRLGGKRLEVKEGVARERKVRVIGEDVVRFGDDVIIEEDEVVEGDAVAIFGNVVVDGVVEGDAVAIGGGLTVGPMGEVDGDGVAIGGGVTTEKGGIIRGETVSFGRGGRCVPRARIFSGSIFSRAGRLFLFIMWTILLIVLGLIIAAVLKRPVDNVCVRARKEAFKMGLIGLLTQVLVIPLIVLFVITIIGIPIGIVVIPLVFTLALLLGYVGVSLAVGERLGNGTGRSPYMSIAIGVLSLQALAILGGILRLPGGPLGVVGSIISFIGWAVIYVAATVGLGAVIMSRFGTKGVEVKAVESV